MILASLLGVVFVAALAIAVVIVAVHVVAGPDPPEYAPGVEVEALEARTVLFNARRETKPPEGQYERPVDLRAPAAEAAPEQQVLEPPREVQGVNGE